MQSGTNGSLAESRQWVYDVKRANPQVRLLFTSATFGGVVKTTLLNLLGRPNVFAVGRTSLQCT